MMNFVALGLVLTSLVTAGFFTPTPQNPGSRGEDDVIVKEGHRVVMVEYEKDDGNTKVLISPQEKGFAASADKLSQKIKEGVKGDSSSAVDELGNLVGKNDELDETIRQKVRPRELVCDAYGKCKHKIASAFEKTKASAEEAAGRVKDKFEEGKEKMKDSASELSSKAAEKAEGAKEAVSEKAEGAKEALSEKAEGAKEAVSEKAEGAKEAVSEKARAAKEAGRRVGKRGKKELREILRHAGEVAEDVFEYMAPRERVAPVAGVAHLMGFAAAYGMCVWMTFASSYVLARALPRQQFAVVQSKIYPVYFKGMGCSVGMALLGHLVGRPQPASVAVLQAINLAAALTMILTNLMWLEPQATKVMLERMKKEKEEGAVAVEASKKVGESIGETAGRGPSSEEAAARSEIIRLGQTLERLNSYSSFLNAFTLVSLTWHLVHLSQRLMC